MDGSARLLAEAHHGVLSGLPTQAGLRWRELLEVLALGEEWAERGQSLSTYAVTRFLVDDRENQGSILSCMAAARANLRVVREKVPVELREAVNDCWSEACAVDYSAELREEPQQLFARITRASQTLHGVTESTMSRNDGWRFLTLGRMTERALLTTRLIDVYFSRLVGAVDRPPVRHWSNLLRAAGALQEYRRVFHTSLAPTDAIGFLMRDDDFPRSVWFCVCWAEHQLGSMAAASGDKTDSGAHKMMQQLKDRLDLPLSELLGDSPTVALRAIAADLEAFSDQVHTEFFPEPS
jgi:uncharacterized alpha-E superfamily protein